jgi:hypothetical protein
LGENGSIDGAMISTRSASITSGMDSLREKTKVVRFPEVGREESPRLVRQLIRAIVADGIAR